MYHRRCYTLYEIVLSTKVICSRVTVSGDIGTDTPCLLYTAYYYYYYYYYYCDDHLVRSQEVLSFIQYLFAGARTTVIPVKETLGSIF
jgi:hypothetical protein